MFVSFVSMVENYLDLFSSVVVMFFIFYLLVRWFISSFERRISFIEGLYNDLRMDLKDFKKELHLLNDSLRSFRDSLERFMGSNKS